MGGGPSGVLDGGRGRGVGGGGVGGPQGFLGVDVDVGVGVGEGRGQVGRRRGLDVLGRSEHINVSREKRERDIHPVHNRAK